MGDQTTLSRHHVLLVYTLLMRCKGLQISHLEMAICKTRHPDDTKLLQDCKLFFGRNVNVSVYRNISG